MNDKIQVTRIDLLKLLRTVDVYAKWPDMHTYAEYVDLKRSIVGDTRINDHLIKFTPPIYRKEPVGEDWCD